MITFERLKELVKYNRRTGEFTSRISRKGVSSGAKMGCINKHLGYQLIGLDKTHYYGHRLAWLYVYGEIKSEIDHINGNRSDNRICNLREATSSQNKYNAKRRIDNRSGYKGVYLHTPGKWRARIRQSGKLIEVGLFDSPEEAFFNRKKMLSKIHGEYARAE